MAGWIYTIKLHRNKLKLQTMGEKNFICRWAFLGLSTIAENFIVDLLLQRPDDDPIAHELVTVSTTGPKERATTWLKNHNFSNASEVTIYTSIEEMLAKGDFDIIYISTPPPPLPTCADSSRQ